MEENVIVARFGRGNTARTAAQFRLNRGQRLTFEGLELPSVYQVHFANQVFGSAKTVIASGNSVVIPHEFFIPGENIYAWIYVSTEDYGITKYQVTIPVSPRADISDQTPDPDEQTIIEQAIDLLNEAADKLPEVIDEHLREAQATGDFNGVDGSTIWMYLSVPIMSGANEYSFYISLLRGTLGAIPKVNDYILVGEKLYAITDIGQVVAKGTEYANLKGTSPTVTLTETGYPVSQHTYVLTITDITGAKSYELVVPSMDEILERTGEYRVYHAIYENGFVYDQELPDMEELAEVLNGKILPVIDLQDINGAIFGDNFVAHYYLFPQELSYANNPQDCIYLFGQFVQDAYNRVVQVTVDASSDGWYLHTRTFITDEDIPSDYVSFEETQDLTENEKIRARSNIGAASIADMGTVFDIKGEVATVNDLPVNGNRVGDVYFVVSKSVAFVWLETQARPNGYWEEFGEPIDLSGYATIADLANKVDKIAGKGLSTNDYTTAEKNKLAGVATGAQVNIIESVKVNGTVLTPTNKTVNISVPTKTSDLTNDSGFAAEVIFDFVLSAQEMIIDGPTWQEVVDTTPYAIARVHFVGESDLMYLPLISDTGTFSGLINGDICTIRFGDDEDSWAWEAELNATEAMIPTKTSDLTNDSGFLTQHQDISGKLDKDFGIANAGKFVVVGNDGIATAITMTAWQGGSY